MDYDDVKPPRAWRVREFIGDLVNLKDQPGHGVVDDLLFSNEGELLSVLVRPSYRWGMRGSYAYPFYGPAHGWEPGLGFYDLPYTREEVTGYQPLRR